MKHQIYRLETNRRYLFAIKIIFGFLVILFSMTVKADDIPTITIDVNNPNDTINYDDVDKFEAAQNLHQVKFAAKDGDRLTLSDKPIITAKPYSPTTLADLGWTVNRQAMVVKTPGFEIAINNAQNVPVIPPMIKAPITAPAGITIVSATQPVSSSQQLSGVQPAILSAILWLITAISTFAIITLLLQSRQRPSTQQDRAIRYAGKLGAPTEMIGEGELFDFSAEAIHGKVTQINTTYLNMLWHLGRFSNNSAVDTYFYMAFYIPPQLKYADTLKRKIAKKESTT